MEAALDKAKQYEWFALKLLPMIDQGWLMSPIYLFTILVLFSYGMIFFGLGITIIATIHFPGTLCQ